MYGNAVPSRDEVTEQRASRFNTGHGDNTYNSGAGIGDKKTRAVQTRHETRRQISGREKSMCSESTKCGYSLLFTPNIHIDLLDPLLQRFYGGDS
jgi:hypothetical protein